MFLARTGLEKLVLFANEQMNFRAVHLSLAMLRESCPIKLTVVLPGGLLD
jgi:hypothetical protein